MRYRNTITGAVIDSNSVISGANWQELTPAGFSLKKDEVAPVQQEKPEDKSEGDPKEEKTEAAETPKKEPEQAEEKAAKGKGAVIKPKKGK